MSHARLSPRLGRVLVIAIAWTAVLVLFYANAYMLIGDLTRLGKLTGRYPFLPDFAGTIVLGLFGGGVGGYLLVYRINSGHRHKSFASDIVRSGLLFMAVYLGAGVGILFTLAFLSQMSRVGAAEAALAGWHNVVVNMYTPSFAMTSLVWGTLASGTQFLLQVNDKFGPGVLWQLIRGRYYHPREEERVFMFLDLQSSTPIAESLGHDRYFRLLRQLCQDVTEPILRCSGEIYQYVGDQIVISWPPPRNRHDTDCIRCFFEIDRVLAQKRADYVREFDVAPVFKAGLHLGTATIGEIGVVKKDIVFSGDVMNTTARIQAECNRHGVNLLASADLLERLDPGPGFRTRSIGEISLRGKAEPLPLATVEPVAPASATP